MTNERKLKALDLWIKPHTREQIKEMAEILDIVYERVHAYKEEWIGHSEEARHLNLFMEYMRVAYKQLSQYIEEDEANGRPNRKDI